MAFAKSPAHAPKVAAEFRRCTAAFVAVAVFSGCVNVLYLTGSLFMMEVYDRVLPSRSVPTLVGLLAIVVFLYLFQGVLDFVRGRLLLRIADRIELGLSEPIYRAAVDLQLRAPATARASQPLRDLDTLRSFLSGSGPTALFDLPWLPFYLAICFAFHFWIGVAALGGTVLLVTLTLVSELVSRRPVRDAAGHGTGRARLYESSRRHAEIVSALGMTPRLAARWLKASRDHAHASQRAADLTSGLGSLSKTLRMTMQSGIMAVGAYLVINDQATAGIIIASSILSARALAPVDLALANWKGFVAARQSKARIDGILALLARTPERMALPAPHRDVAVEHVTLAAPESQTTILHDVNFRLAAGSGVGVIGPSGSGKSTLARLLAGVWSPARGAVRLDGAALDQWPRADHARHVGYMPQAAALIDGTIAENIAAFDPDATSQAVVAAARAAGAHELIVGLPEGYATRIDETAVSLSAGQQQRIALARALYGDPFLVILDEPNSNLDADGEEALTEAIQRVRARGGIVVVIAHRPSALAGVDHVLMLAQGRVQAFGPKDEVLAAVLRPVPARRTGAVAEAAATEGVAA